MYSITQFSTYDNTEVLYMMDQAKPEIKQTKYMCGTCKNSGRILDYIGRGKTRKMLLWCEVHRKGVMQDDLCQAYKNEKGNSLYK